jgi:hypothetical protein
MLLDSPLAFGMVLLKLRRIISSPRVEMYLGGIIAKYHIVTCWWELVLVVPELFLALVLRGIDESSSLYGGLINVDVNK